MKFNWVPGIVIALLMVVLGIYYPFPMSKEGVFIRNITPFLIIFILIGLGMTWWQRRKKGG